MVRKRWVASAMVGVALAAWGAVLAEVERSTKPVPPEVARGMDELWRRGFCMLSSVLEPAKRAAATPDHPEGLALIRARTYHRTERLACWALAGNNIYLGSDCAVYEVDTRTSRPVRSWCLADGLPDSPVEELVPDGQRLWVVTRRGLCAIDLTTGKVLSAGMPRFTVGVVVPTTGAVWVFADTGTYLLQRGSARWALGQPIPTSDRITRLVQRGFWFARWRDRTKVLFRQVLARKGYIWVISLGSLLRMDCRTGNWQELGEGVWQMAAGADRIWLLTTKGVGVVGEGEPQISYPSAGQPPVGRPVRLVVHEGDVWVLTAPSRISKNKVEGGGLYRWSRSSRSWEAYPRIAGHSTRFGSFLGVVAGRLWFAGRVYDHLVVKSAHPGMMHVKRVVPHTTGVLLAHYEKEGNTWRGVVVPTPKTKHRYVLGQRGTRGEDLIGPEEVVQLAQFGRELFAVVREFPRKYYAGYLLSVYRVLRGEEPALTDYAGQLGLVGEQPEIMLLSGTHGARIIQAAGQERVLTLRLANGALWTITERCAARWEAGEGRWHIALRTPRRFYWQATAAAVGPKTVWFGSDRGVIARFDRSTGRFTVVGLVPDSRITSITIGGNGRVYVHADPIDEGRLPADMRDLVRLPKATDLVFDGAHWKPFAGETPPSVKPVRRHWSTGALPNILRCTGGHSLRSAYVLGVFRPRILCEETGDVVWLATYSGLARVDLSEAREIPLERVKSALMAREASKRLWGVRAAGNLADRSLAPMVAALLKDPNRTVRREAVLALRQLADPAVEPQIIAALDDDDPIVRRTAVDLCGRLRLKPAVPTLLRHLRDEDFRTRVSVVYALARIGDATAIPALETLLGENPAKPLHRALVRALKQLKRVRGER